MDSSYLLCAYYTTDAMLNNLHVRTPFKINVNRYSVWDNQRVLEIDSVDGYAVWMFLVPLKCTLKSGQNSKFYVIYILLPPGGSESRLDWLTSKE